MYFSLNYLLNTFFVFFFIFSFFYLTINLVFFFEKKKILIKNNYNYLTIFFLLFAFLSAIFNILFFFDFLNKSIIKFILYFFYLILILSIFLNLENKKYIFDKFLIFLFILNKKKYFIILFTCFFILSTLPLSDADSLIYFNIPKQILSFGKILGDISYIESRLISSAEIILVLSFITNLDNFSSILNCTCLFFLCCSLAKDKKFDAIFFIISTPLILYFITSGKLQLFYTILYFVIFLFLKSIKKFNNFNIFILCALIIFFISGKVSNILIALPITFFLFYKIYKKFFFKTIFFFTLSFILIYSPILLKKFLIYGDPLSPFFEFYKENPNLVVSQFAYNLRSSQGWLGLEDLNSVIMVILKIFFPLSLSEITNTLGLGALLIFFINLYKPEKEIYILSLANITLVLLTGQILPRYFMESFFLLSLSFSSLKFGVVKKIFLYIFKIKVLLIMVFSIIFISYSLYLFYPFVSKEKYLEKFAFTYSYAKQIKKLQLKENVLSLDVERKSIFFETNFFGTRSLILKENKLKNLINFIKNENIKYLISKELDVDIVSCLDLELINSFNYVEQARRNFLVPSIESHTYVYKILHHKNECKFED